MTTRIRLLTSSTGGVRGDHGDIIEVSEAVAKAWCDGVRAERVRDEPPEAAVRRAPERAARRVSNRSS